MNVEWMREISITLKLTSGTNKYIFQMRLRLTQTNMNIVKRCHYKLNLNDETRYTAAINQSSLYHLYIILIGIARMGSGQFKMDRDPEKKSRPGCSIYVMCVPKRTNSYWFILITPPRSIHEDEQTIIIYSKKNKDQTLIINEERNKAMANQHNQPGNLTQLMDKVHGWGINVLMLVDNSGQAHNMHVF